MATYRSLTAWRARIGLLLPSLDQQTEPILCQLLPDGVSFHVARFKRVGPVTKESLIGMNEFELDSAIDRLMPDYLDLIIYHCTSGSFVTPPEEITERIETRLGVPAIATALSIIEALKELGVKQLSLVTPYIAEINDMEVDYLESHGFGVIKTGGKEMDDTATIQHTAPEEIALWAKRADVPDADCVFISCTGLRSLEVIDRLEKDLGKPVIASTTAMIWHTLKSLRIADPILGYGKILNLSRT
jgi:maleate cis-trans isomerase